MKTKLFVSILAIFFVSGLTLESSANETFNATKLTCAVDLRYENKHDSASISLPEFFIIYQDEVAYLSSLQVVGEINPFAKTIFLKVDSASTYLSESFPDHSSHAIFRALSAITNWRSSQDSPDSLDDPGPISCVVDPVLEELVNGVYCQAVTLMILAAIPALSDSAQFRGPLESDLVGDTIDTKMVTYSAATFSVDGKAKKQLRTYVDFSTDIRNLIPLFNNRREDTTLSHVLFDHAVCHETRGLIGRPVRVQSTSRFLGKKFSCVVTVRSIEPFMADAKRFTDHGENWKRVRLDSVVIKEKK